MNLYIKSILHPNNKQRDFTIVPPDQCPYCNKGIYPKILSLFSTYIMELSSSFVTIYNQAEITGNSKLTEIYGQGYPKSLEFLVKDYASKFHPNDIHIIKNINLSQCIEAKKLLNSK